MFLHDCIILQDEESYVIIDNGTQFVESFFPFMFVHLDTKHLIPTKYYPQTNGQMEWYNESIVTRLRYYVAYYQRFWKISVETLTSGTIGKSANPAKV